eukprot:2700193-Prymnesium_polylepis.1
MCDVGRFAATCVHGAAPGTPAVHTPAARNDVRSTPENGSGRGQEGAVRPLRGPTTCPTVWVCGGHSLTRLAGDERPMRAPAGGGMARSASSAGGKDEQGAGLCLW